MGLMGMADTVATIIGAIAVTALSGLTVLAYKHPKAYQKLVLVLNGLIILGWVGGLSWSLSNQWVRIAVDRVAYDLYSGKASALGKAVDEYALPSWLLWAFIASSLYIQFLVTFPWWLLDEQPPEKAKQLVLVRHQLFLFRSRVSYLIPANPDSINAAMDAAVATRLRNLRAIHSSI
jgi:hypothetical protein